MNGRRGIVLAAVAVICAASLWLAVALMAQATVDMAGIDGGVDDVQRQSAMRSAMLVIASSLHDQRDEMRDGVIPTLESQFVLWEVGPTATVARLIEHPDGRLLLPEAACVDLNLATSEMLSEVPGLDEESAAAVVSRRSSTRIDEVRDLLEINVADGAALQGDTGLASRLTVHAHEPNLQSSGDLRINLSMPWSEELAGRIRERFGEGAVTVLKQVAEDDPMESDGDLVSLMMSYSVPPSGWTEPLDVLTTETGNFRRGRIDINTAGVAVLATLPGVTTEQAAAIVDRRDQLEEDVRLTATWPFTQEILPIELAPDVLPRMTVGSWTWRVRVACGELPTDTLDAALHRPLIFELIIDVAGEQPLLASVRDVTMESHALAWRPSLDEIEQNEPMVLPPEPTIPEELADDVLELPTEEQPDTGTVMEDNLEPEPTPPPDDPRLGRWHP